MEATPIRVDSYTYALLVAVIDLGDDGATFSHYGHMVSVMVPERTRQSVSRVVAARGLLTVDRKARRVRVTEHGRNAQLLFRDSWPRVRELLAKLDDKPA